MMKSTTSREWWTLALAIGLLVGTACTSSSSDDGDDDNDDVATESDTGVDTGDTDDGEDSDSESASASDQDTGPLDTDIEGAYKQCDPLSPDCPETLACTTTLNDPLYGQCTRTCSENSECPAPPDPATMQVGCNTTNNTCYVLCGDFESECPTWLECYNLQMCVEPSANPGTGQPGDDCDVIEDCAGAPDEATCVEGESSGMKYCSPLCDPANAADPVCTDGLTNAQAQCLQITATQGFCLYMCGLLAPGKVCPGDLGCLGGICQ